MQTHTARPFVTGSRFGILICGLILGGVVTTYWPHEPLLANATGLEKFAICTAPTLVNQSDAVFVLDSVTGRLVGAAHNGNAGKFTQVWTRSVAADFNVVENGQYLLTSGFLRTQGAAAGTPAQSGIYVAELTSGKVGLYGFLMNNQNQAAIGELVPLDSFSFRGNNSR